MRKAHGALAALVTTGIVAVAAVPAEATQTLGEDFTPTAFCGGTAAGSTSETASRAAVATRRLA